MDSPDEEWIPLSRRTDGVWQVTRGRLVKVVISLQTPKARYNVALVDKLPAGLEIDNKQDVDKLNTPRWYDHVNLRDERVECFINLLQLINNSTTFVYLARAITPGIFIVPPVSVTEMYCPDIYGQSESYKFMITE